MITSNISKTPHIKKDAPHRDCLYVEAIPKSTKDLFKRVARVKRKETMRDAVIKMMRYYIAMRGRIPVVHDRE